MLNRNSDCIPRVDGESLREKQSIEGKKGGSRKIPRFLVLGTKVKN